MDRGVDQQIRLLGLFLFSFYAVWFCWAVLLVQFPARFDADVWRTTVRILVWVAPVFLFVRFIEGPPVLDRLGLRAGAAEGIVTGLVVSVMLAPALSIVRHRFVLPHFVFPTGTWTWLSTILLAPFAEELMFRGLVYRFLRDRTGIMHAVWLSSVLFALIHLPYWWLSGAKTGIALGLALLEICGIGVLLCGLYQWKRSLWTPVLYHAANNFISVALG
jgi:uncharacterized protein